VIETVDGEKLEFEAVGIVENDDGKEPFVVGYSEAGDRFAVFDAFGTLLPDDALAQEILDSFLAFTEEPADDE
jgi:hypothetical protein